MASENQVSDNEKYQALMGRYKDLRGKLGVKALAYLEAAMELKKKGKVSEDVVTGSAYL
jgi:hypothetical protein